MTLLDAGTDFHQAVDLPLPYRIFLLLGLGILGWATNLHGLEALDVDVVAALDLRPDDAASHGDPLLVDTYGHVPLLTGIALVFLVWCPAERDKFVHAIRRCLFSSLNTPVLFRTFPYFVRFRQCLIEYNLPQNDSRRPFFNAVKYATSFPVIFLSAAQRVVPTANQVSLEDGQAPVSTDSWHGDHQIFKLWLLAVFVNSAYSFWWDITNDWGFDLLRPAATSTRQPAKRLLLPLLHSRTPLLTRENSLESQSSTESEPSHRRPSMSISMSDVPKSLRKSYPYGLRPILLYPLTVYPLLIFLNLVLRMSWSRDGSMAIFWLEVAELVRRWLWVFIRVEWEMVKRMQAAPLHTGKIEVDGISGDEAVSFEVLMPEVVQVLPDA
ncbi:EXS family-domain-containing protein [Ephemerocybe angulata]|uniref:EXS family-domain-containing protein n=1 Tax=Ephemerocybe angulata TaxID=980116 RepID=A0A8H6ICL6_9AGAR|nr:EXS family-domain-containing protein [Tulosesus angulatus]